MRRHGALCLVSAFLCWMGSAAAQPATSPANPHMSLALEILTVTDAKANMVRMSDLMEPNMLQMIAQAHPGLDQKTLDALRAAFHQEVQASMDNLMNQIAQIYVRHFTDEDMRTILAFYKTDTGRKMLAEMPAVIKESAVLGQSWGQQVGNLAGQRAIARLKSQGYKI
jgi:uncharacterized protein